MRLNSATLIFKNSNFEIRRELYKSVVNKFQRLITIPEFMKISSNDSDIYDIVWNEILCNVENQLMEDLPKTFGKSYFSPKQQKTEDWS